MGANRQVIGLVFAGILLLSAYFVYQHYTSYLEKSKAEVMTKLQAIASTTALQIDGEAHRRLSQSRLGKGAVLYNAQDANYWQVHRQLVRSMNANHLTTPLHTLTYRTDTHAFEYMVTSVIKPYYRHAYGPFPPALLQNYSKGGQLDVYPREKGLWLSAFAPIRDASGNTVAILIADEDFSLVLAKARRELWDNILVFCYGFGLTMLVLFPVLGNILKREDTYKRMLVQQNDDIRIQNEEIKSQNEEIEAQNSLLANAQGTIEKQNDHLRRLNEALDQRMQLQTLELEQVNLDLATFLYRSSHDIHGPLATLKGLCTLAKLEIQDEQAHDFFNKIFQTTLHLERFVKHMNAVYEIKSQPLQIRGFHLKEMVDAIIRKQLEYTHTDASTQFYLEIPASLSVHSDYTLVDMAFSELIRNAIYYQREDRSELHWVKITVIERERHILEIFISDNGTGINPQNEDKIFGMFERASEASQGAGLGLYIAKMALERLGAHIDLVKPSGITTSEVNTLGVTTPGATFRITLPDLQGVLTRVL